MIKTKDKERPDGTLREAVAKLQKFIAANRKNLRRP
jgi:hypothetical protein